jgi:hypothetical protein
LTGVPVDGTETLDRVNQTGEAEIITVNGEARCVLLAPAVFDELAREYHLTRDVEMMRQAVNEINEGKGLDARVAFDELRAKLLAMKAAKNGKAK